MLPGAAEVLRMRSDVVRPAPSLGCMPAWRCRVKCKKKAPEGTFLAQFIPAPDSAAVAIRVARHRALDAMPCGAGGALGLVPRQARIALGALVVTAQFRFGLEADKETGVTRTAAPVARCHPSGR